MAACSATSPLSVSGSSGHRQLRSESEQKEIDEFEEEERKIMSQQDSQVSIEGCYLKMDTSDQYKG